MHLNRRAPERLKSRMIIRKAVAFGIDVIALLVERSRRLFSGDLDKPDADCYTTQSM
jgi:hypothetical protein